MKDQKISNQREDLATAMQFKIVKECKNTVMLEVTLTVVYGCLEGVLTNPLIVRNDNIVEAGT
jgi:hypothetical protein